MQVMLKKLLFILSICATFSSVFAQNKKTPGSLYLVRATLGSSGSSSFISTKKGTYLVSQSIGQSSVIGTFSKNNYTIRQGFQQPLISAQLIKTDNNWLNVSLFPNPFDQTINIRFGDIIENEIIVIVYNLSGAILHSKTYPPAQLLHIPLESLSNGNYILKITSDKKQMVSTIIKQ